MPLNTPSELPPSLVRLLKKDRSGLPRLIGSPGYELPTLDGHEILPLTAQLKHPSIKLSDKGEAGGNFIVIAPQARPFRLQITLGPNAKNNIIVLGRDCAAHAEFDIRARGGQMIIGERAHWEAYFYARLSSDDEVLYWGGASKSNGVRITIEGKDRSVIIGEDCMFAPGTEIRTSDLHAVIDMSNNGWLNKAEDVLLEPHVWLGLGSLVLKGVKVGFGSVIAAKSVVTRDVPRFSIAAGVPAKIIRNDASWDSKVEPQKDQASKLRAMCARLDGK